MNDEKLLRLALEAIERGVRDGYWNKDTVDVSTAIQKRLLQNSPTAALVQEPVAWALSHSRGLEFSSKYPMQKYRELAEQMAGQYMGKVTVTPLYTSPPAQRKPLTSQERDAQRWRFLMENSYDSESVTQFHVWEHSWEPHSKTGEPTEWKQRVRGIALIDFIDRAIEAKLKEKNT
jgi:hypothetical protein